MIFILSKLVYQYMIKNQIIKRNDRGLCIIIAVFLIFSGLCYNHNMILIVVFLFHSLMGPAQFFFNTLEFSLKWL